MEAPTPVQSHFLPDTHTQFAWDSTSLQDFKKCPRYYQYVHIEGWSPKDDNIHLRFGIEYHQALHDYELGKATGASHDDALRVAVRDLLSRCVDYPDVDPNAKPSIRVKTKTNLVRTVVWYLDQFRDDPAETVMMDGNIPALEVSFKFELDWGPAEDGVKMNIPHQPYILCGHLDRIVRFNDEIFVMDRKTASTTLTPRYFDQYEPHTQMTLYSIAGQVVLGTAIRGVIIDAAAIQVGGSWFQRGFTYRTQAQLEEWMADLRLVLYAAEAMAVAGYWPMNDTACDKYGGCRFRNVCNKDPRVRESFLRADFKQLPKEARWSPLRSR